MERREEGYLNLGGPCEVHLRKFFLRRSQKVEAQGPDSHIEARMRLQTVIFFRHP